MTYTRNHARPLLSDSEYDLFTASLSDRIGDLDQAGLKKKIDRARRARDRASDLAKRQAIKVRKTSGARGGAGTANERSKKKVVMLSEALGRFEKRLAALEDSEARAKERQALSKAKSGRGSGPTKGGAANRASRRGGGRSGFTSGSASVSAESSRRAPQTRINASRAAAGRRGQARRDTR